MPDEIKPVKEEITPVETQKDDLFSYIGKFKFKLRLLNSFTPCYLPMGTLRGVVFIIFAYVVVWAAMNGVILDEWTKNLIFGYVSLYVGSRLNFDRPREG
jgi:hypothetical protein